MLVYVKQNNVKRYVGLYVEGFCCSGMLRAVSSNLIYLDVSKEHRAFIFIGWWGLGEPKIFTCQITATQRSMPGDQNPQHRNNRSLVGTCSISHEKIKLEGYLSNLKQALLFTRQE